MTGNSACEQDVGTEVPEISIRPEFVLKHADTFAVLDSYGDIGASALGEEGVYHYGCRCLSGLTTRFCNRRPLLLGSSLRDDNLLLSVDLTNPDAILPNGEKLDKDTIHIRRQSLLREDAFWSQFEFRNYGSEAVVFDFSLEFKADFVDVFEVRGVARETRGKAAEPEIVGREGVEYEYEGLDQQTRHTHILFNPPATEINDERADFRIELHPGEAKVVTMSTLFGAASTPSSPFISHLGQATSEYEREAASNTLVSSTNEHFNDWVRQSAADLRMLTTHTQHGPYLYAGIPWFSTPFGRDGIIAALMFMWVNPEPAKGVLRFLAANQASELDPSRDAEPGKILHEFRYGEMAALSEVPYRNYFGSVDSTPLFIVLASAYYRHTADREMLQLLWPHVLRGLEWIENYGDQDGDGFIEYERKSEDGILSQGWKDSNDSVFHADGTLTDSHVALCEVQGYVYQAYRGAALMAEALGKMDISQKYHEKATRLRDQFAAAFWSDELGSYALALDRDKRQCKVRASNAGHCLFSEIARPEHAQIIARNLLSKQMFSGWGIRTLAEGEARYNPMAYHNGSVWPHDNAMITQGLAKYGHIDEALMILQSHFDLSKYIGRHRLPELVCGFPRTERSGPTHYPVACSPQAWAAGAVFMMLAATWGMDVDALQGKLTFRNPRIPREITRFTIERLKVGNAELDLVIQRHRHDVSVNVLRRVGDVRIVVDM